MFTKFVYYYYFFVYNIFFSGEQQEHTDRKHPHPLPMPEYGGWFAPLTEFLPDPSSPINTFHRCNLAAILLTDLVVDGLDLGT